MTSPIHRQVLTPKKPLRIFRLEQKIKEQNERIQTLEDALEDATAENKELRTTAESGGMDVPYEHTKFTQDQSKSGSPLFNLSL